MSCCSSRKRHANRANAQKSTGPRTEEGKKRASRNATTHGIFCHDLVLPGEDAAMFNFIREGLLKSYNPQDLSELLLVDRIVAATWKLRRLQSTEHMLFREQALRSRRETEDICNAFEGLRDDERDGDLKDHHGRTVITRSQRDNVEALRRELDAGRVPPEVLCAAARVEADDPSEKLSRLEQRLETSMHRAMRELERRQRERRKRQAQGRDELIEVKSPYAAREVEVEEDDGRESPSAQNEAKPAQITEESDEAVNAPPSPLQGEGRGEGRGSSDSGNAAPLSDPRFDPHPNPLPARERGVTPTG
jgi:hypothetical protein